MTAENHSIKFSRPLRGARLALYTLEEVQQRVALAERSAYEGGRSAGERALAEQLIQQRTDLISLQNGILTLLRESVQRTLVECETLMVDVAVETATRLVGDMPVSRELIESSVRDALRLMQGSAAFTVLLHPEDHALVAGLNAGSLASRTNGSVEGHFEPDPTVSRGGCVVKTSFGVLDARREVKISLLKESLGL